jgi:hypothetical protein
LCKKDTNTSTNTANKKLNKTYLQKETKLEKELYYTHTYKMQTHGNLHGTAMNNQ